MPEISYKLDDRKSKGVAENGRIKKKKNLQTDVAKCAKVSDFLKN